MLDFIEIVEGGFMRKVWVLSGLSIVIIGIAIGIYASQRNCLVAFLTQGYMSFWTGVEILSGFVVLIGLIIAVIGAMKKT